MLMNVKQFLHSRNMIQSTNISYHTVAFQLGYFVENTVLVNFSYKQAAFDCWGKEEIWESLQLSTVKSYRRMG